MASAALILTSVSLSFSRFTMAEEEKENSFSLVHEKTTMYQVTTMLATSKNILLTIGTDDPALYRLSTSEGDEVPGHQ